MSEFLPLYVHPTFFYPLSVMDPGCFHFLNIVNNASMNTGMQVQLRDSAFNSSRHIPKSRVADSCTSPIFYFLRPTILFSIAVVIYIYCCPQCPK